MDGKILKKLRIDANLTQAELAKALDLNSGAMISMLESNEKKGSIETLKKIADYFKVSIDFLEGRTVNSPSFGVVDTLIDGLLKSGRITDPNNIDDLTKELILNIVKNEIALKMKNLETDAD